MAITLSRRPDCEFLVGRRSTPAAAVPKALKFRRAESDEPDEVVDEDDDEDDDEDEDELDRDRGRPFSFESPGLNTFLYVAGTSVDVGAAGGVDECRFEREDAAPGASSSATASVYEGGRSSASWSGGATALLDEAMLVGSSACRSLSFSSAADMCDAMLAKPPPLYV